MGRDFRDKGITSAESRRPGLSKDLGELIAVVGLRDRSKVMGGLANVAVPDWSDYFTFIIHNHRYWC
jgi:hypothetical protein